MIRGQRIVFSDMKIAGLDIGTTGCKLTVFNVQGILLGSAYHDYPVRRSVSGHEIDLSNIMYSVYAVIREMASQFPDIRGIGVTSFGETFIMTDKHGEPLHTAMLYTDPRGAAECRELMNKLGEQHIAEVTGHHPHEMYSISKMMWIKRNCPEIYAKTCHIHLIEDFVVRHLSGKTQIDYSLAARTMAFDIRNMTWSREIFDAAEIDMSFMSEPVPTGTPAGKVTPETVQKTGLSPDCVIVSISHDQVAAAVGAGAFDDSVAVDGAGTVECLTPIYNSIPDIDVMRKGHFSVVPYALPGKYVAYAFSYTGGALIQWFTDTLAKEDKQIAKNLGISVNQYLEEQYKGNKPTGLLVLPHFAGAATPYMDTGSKGAILGLSTATDAAALYRACMEGVAYEMCINYDALKGSGIRFTHLNAAGGGAKSKVWMQMKADILDLPITALKTVDAGTVGSAMLTGVASGLFGNLEEAAEVMVQEAETYLPDAAMHDNYTKIYERYKAVYKTIRPLMEGD